MGTLIGSPEDADDTDGSSLLRRRTSSVNGGMVSVDREDTYLAYASPTPSVEKRESLGPPLDTTSIHSIPWKEFFTNPISLNLFLSHWTTSWIGFMLLSELPTFLTDELGYDIESAGIMSVIPYIANFCSSIMFAMLFDYLEVKYCSDSSHCYCSICMMIALTVIVRITCTSTNLCIFQHRIVLTAWCYVGQERMDHQRCQTSVHANWPDWCRRVPRTV